MKSLQYTIRNIPEPVDQYLRKRARLSGQSLNQVVIDELSEKAGIGSESILDSLDWFIGSGMDEDVLKALEEEDKIQKEIARKELENAT